MDVGASAVGLTRGAMPLDFTERVFDLFTMVAFVSR
jgi:hypothetical protein